MNDKQIIPALFARALSVAYQGVASVELIAARRIPPRSASGSVICVRAIPSRTSVRGKVMSAHVFTMTFRRDEPLMISAGLLSGAVLGDVQPAFMADMPSVRLTMRSRSLPEQRYRNGVISVATWWGITASLTD